MYLRVCRSGELRELYEANPQEKYCSLYYQSLDEMKAEVPGKFRYAGGYEASMTVSRD